MLLADKPSKYWLCLKADTNGRRSLREKRQ